MTGGGRAAAVALAAALLAAGCATVQANGPLQQVGSAQSGLSQEQEYSQPVPIGPQPGWTPREIVDGFLSASASFANDPQVAREYLDSTAQAAWQPGWAVTVVSGPPVTSPAPPLPRSVSNEKLERVKVTGQPVATITGSGQYQVYSGSSTESYYFSLLNIGGQWRIDGLPKWQGMLLTEADFQHVYQPRDLYFLSQLGNRLVPDPVFVPQQATNTELATGLVNALLADPTGWLSGAAMTGFPAHTQQIGQVRLDGQNATVDLGGEHGKPLTASNEQLQQMAAQLAWTLATGPTPIQSVELELNNHPKGTGGGLYHQPGDYQGWVPTQAAGSSLYFIGGTGAVQALSGVGQSGTGQPGRVTTVPGAAGSAGVPPLTSIAISPDGSSLAGIADDGAAVYYTTKLDQRGTLKEWRPTNGSCTSVSWDANGNLWISGGGFVWMLPSGGGSAAPVSVAVSAADDVTDFQVAPDGVRAAMIVHGPKGNSVEIGAITHAGQAVAVQREPVTIGAGVPQPDALAWYGTDDVLVLAGSSANAQLYEVPLNGGPPVMIPTPRAPESVTATSPEGSPADIAIGLSGGKIMVSTNLGAFEPTRAAGQEPVYPG
jgi:hypothetical protein